MKRRQPTTPSPLPKDELTVEERAKGTVLGSVWLSRSLGVALILAVLAFVAWCGTAAYFTYKATDAIAHTTLLCVDRMIAEIDVRVATKSENEELKRENARLRGRVEVFEGLYGLSREAYLEAKGVGGD